MARKVKPQDLHPPTAHVGRTVLLHRVLMALVASAVLFQLAVRPLVGVADNGDFPRVMARFLLGSDIQDRKDRFFGYFISRYRFDPSFNWDGGFRSSQELPVRAALAVNRLVSKDGWFDLRSLACVYLAILLGVMWLLLKYTPAVSPPGRAVIYGASLLVFTDVGYISYFNSFYSEPATYLFWLAAFVAALLLIEKPSWPLLALWASAALLFVTAKPQNAPLGVIVAAYSARLAVLNRELRWRATTVGIAVALVTASAVYYAITPRKLIVMASHYVVVFREILGHSPDPEGELRELGLSPDLKKYIGTHPYMPTVPFHGPEMQRAFFDHINTGKLLWFYAVHPGRLWGVLDRCARRALWLRSGLGNYEKSAGRKPFAQSESFNWLSRIHRSVFPSTIGGFALFFSLNAVAAAVLYWRRRSSLKDRLYLELFGVLILMAVMQFMVVAVSQGTFDPIKHMFLFTLLFDLMLVMAAVWLSGMAVGLIGRFRPAPSEPGPLPTGGSTTGSRTNRSS